MRWIFVFFFAFFPIAVTGQQVAVQTGEHARFTRVVVTLPPGADWRLGRNDAGYLLRVADIDGYDLRRFFSIIPRTRIADALSGHAAGELQLVVNCACHADAYLDGSRYLVVDIHDGVAPETAAFEAPIDPVPSNLVEVDLPTFDDPDISFANSLLPVVFPPGGGPVSSSQISPQQSIDLEAPPSLAKPVTEQPIAIQSAQAADLLALERSIAESLSRGLSQGVLEADLAPHEGQDMSLEVDVPAPGLETRTSIDLSAIPPNPHIVRNQEGQVCLSDRLFDVGTWGKEELFSQQMGAARARLTGEFDRLDEQAVFAMARLFVFFGFGREAIQTLRLDDVSSQERRYLMAIAQIVDGDPVTPELFERQVSCQSSVALWAMLANGQNALDGQVDPASVLRAFKALPIGLQSHLGPKLSARFLAIGDEESALQALAPAQTVDVPTTDAQLAETALLQDLGETDDALQNLSELARDDATPETMLAFLRAVAAGDLDARASDFSLADALRFENATSPVAIDLAEAQARAHIALDGFGAAQSLIQDISELIDEERDAALINDLVIAATQRMPDAAFLGMAFDNSVWPTDEKAQDDMARRLLDLGFPEQAALLINDDINTVPSVERLALRAETALMLGDAETALGYLDVAGANAENPVRIAALEIQSGLAAIPNLQDDTSEPERLWRQGEWGALQTVEDTLLRNASVAVLEQNVAPLAPDRPLESSRRLLGQSEQSRVVVGDLLDRFAAPSDF